MTYSSTHNFAERNAAVERNGSAPNGIVAGNQLLPQNVEFANGVCIELRYDDGRFLGLGEVSVDGVALRSGRRPMFVEIRNPFGVELCDYEVVSVEHEASLLRLELKPRARRSGPMEWMLHEVRARWNTNDWTQPFEETSSTRLWLEIKPATRKLGDKFWQGFSYQYRYESDDIPLYKILDRATWEIGGAAVGNEFWLRHGAKSVVPIASTAQNFSTEWYLPGIANPNIFQFQPLQTQFQGFTFTASKHGLLATLATEVAHIRSLFEKPRDCDEIVHFHEHCGDLSFQFSTSPMEVLWLPGDFDATAKFNRYEDVRAWLHPELHRQIGMREERVTTYGLIEEWGRADIDRYRRLGAPKLLDAGIKTVALPNHFMNNMNVYGVSNMCCNVDYKFLPEIGAEIKKLGHDVNAGGARLEMWGNTAISTLTIILDNCERKGPNPLRVVPREDSIMEALEGAASPWVRTPSGAYEADHYSPVFAQLNLRDQTVFEYWMKRWGEAKNEYGISSIFVDSSFNMSSDKFSYHYEAVGKETGATIDQTHLLGFGRPAVEPPHAIESQYAAYNALMVAMQEIGYQVLGEDVGVFGISRSGPGIGVRLDNLALWQDCLLAFDIPAIEKAGYNADAIFFRGLAYRQMWILYWDIARDGLSFDYNGAVNDDGTLPHPPNDWHIALFKAYNAAQTMRSPSARRHIFDDETGVQYRDGNRRVVWAFDELTIEINGAATITDLVGGAGWTARDAVTLPRFAVVEIEEIES